MYFLRRSSLKFTFLQKKQQPSINEHKGHKMLDVCFCEDCTAEGGRMRTRGVCVFVLNNGGGGRNCAATRSWPAAHIQYLPRFAYPNNPIPGGKPDPPKSSYLSHLPHLPPPPPLRTRAMKWMRMWMDLEAEEEADPRRSDGGGTPPPPLHIPEPIWSYLLH